MPSAASRSPAAITLAFARGARTTLPSAAMRSVTSSRCRRGTSGLGLSQVRSNMSGMRMRPISSTSRKPRVVISPVLAPDRCRMVLEPTVVPCSTSSTLGRGMSSSASSACRPATTARLGSSGVVETLLSCSTPSPDMTTMSVNVPPMSTATRTPATVTGAGPPYERAAVLRQAQDERGGRGAVASTPVVSCLPSDLFRGSNHGNPSEARLWAGSAQW